MNIRPECKEVKQNKAQPRAFIKALILTPLVTTLPLLPIVPFGTMVAVGAWVLGLPPFIILALPILIRIVRKPNFSIWIGIPIGFGLHLVAACVGALGMYFLDFMQAIDGFVMMAMIFGFIFAPLWCVLFLLFYHTNLRT
ncbi:hypothetical protein [Halomonas sp. hl-4]|uniref:hypothetical protein n=1 Tax=Halomonas sp. hl-4 TaxID=1761789 RepID=UPI000BB90643|nr:hypothetical protein [Halomonas sp. hl-4]SNY98834.1 hypothetical protein SAMN04488142_3467 [Halomonas sp. hl-4]